MTSQAQGQRGAGVPGQDEDPRADTGMTLGNADGYSPKGVHLLDTLFTRNGVAFASSRGVAAHFEKRHDHVLRDIDNLLKSFDSPKLTRGLFTAASMPDGQGIDRRCFNMTRDGFMLLAMGFTGAKALRWKLKYVEAFNAMAATLRARPAIDTLAALRDPATLRALLLAFPDDEKGLLAVQTPGGPVAENRPRGLRSAAGKVG